MTLIQRAGPEDADLIAGIATRSYEESHGHCAAAADVESYLSTKLAKNVIEKELADERNIFHLIYHEDLAAGYSKLILDSPHPSVKDGMVTKLERLYLLKEFYDHKLGLHLFNFVAALSKKSNQAGMWLFVWVKNERAINFYKKEWI